MNQNLNFIVRQFLNTHLNLKKPVLLALSGGADSTVLLDLLRDYQRENFFELHLAHVDHQWREESGAEARILKEMASRLNLPFHLKVLDHIPQAGNLENRCRDLRLSFFKELSKTHDFQAVLLGHHKDDQAETILKRILEGASLENLEGLKPITAMDEMTLWRPLLEVDKNALLSWAQEKKLSYFDDSSNRDLRYLRSRMRTSILPQLSEAFAKEVTEPLIRLGKEAGELKEHLNQKVSGLWGTRVIGPDGLLLDLQKHVQETSLIELKHLLRRVAQALDCSITYPVLDSLCKSLKNLMADGCIEFNHLRWITDRGKLFVLSPPFVKCLEENKILLEEGLNQSFENWDISVSKTVEMTPIQSTWLDCWKGQLSIFLPHGKYFLGYPKLSSPYFNKSSLAKWLSENKVPVFMRKEISIFRDDGVIVHEFLTGKRKLLAPKGEGLSIALKKWRL
jgi:tRNA(Ile)-lysidine synthase